MTLCYFRGACCFLAFSSLKISRWTVRPLRPVLLHSLLAFLFSGFARWRSSENQGCCGLITIDFPLDGACLFSTVVSCVSYLSKRSVTGRLSSRSPSPCSMSVLKLGRSMERKALVIIVIFWRCGLGWWTLHNSRGWSVIISPTWTSCTRLSVSRHMITSNVCPDMWVGLLTCCSIPSDPSISVNFWVVLSAFLSRWKFHQPSISHLSQSLCPGEM